MQIRISTTGRRCRAIWIAMSPGNGPSWCCCTRARRRRASRSAGSISSPDCHIITFAAPTDIARLARSLTGTDLGVVLVRRWRARLCSHRRAACISRSGHHDRRHRRHQSRRHHRRGLCIGVESRRVAGARASQLRRYQSRERLHIAAGLAGFGAQSQSPAAAGVRRCGHRGSAAALFLRLDQSQFGAVGRASTRAFVALVASVRVHSRCIAAGDR